MPHCCLRSLLVTITLVGLCVFWAHSGIFAVGRVGFATSVDPQGAAVVDIPLEMPTTTLKLKPDLWVSYRSSRGVRNGALGAGFYLKGLSQIHPCPMNTFSDGRSRAIHLDDDDRLCLDGERLVLTVGEKHGQDGTNYVTQLNSMTKVVLSASDSPPSKKFVVHRKDGLKMLYGVGVHAVKKDVSGTAAFAWSLSKVIDSAGNYYTISYNADYDPEVIEMTMNDAVDGADTPYAQVKFVYEARPDRIPLFLAGHALGPRSKRLTKLEIVVEGETRLSYGFSYIQSCSNGVSLLSAISKCDGTGSYCYPATKFDYHSDCTPSFPLTAATQLPLELSEYLPIASVDLSRIHSGNFGGVGGFDDFYVIEEAGSHASDAIYVRQVDGTYRKKPGLRSFVPSSVEMAEFEIGRYKFVDYTGNGYLDIYLVSDRGSCAPDTIYLNDGTGSYPRSIHGPPTCISSDIQHALMDLQRIRFGDFNGDSKLDVYVVKGLHGPEVDDLYLNSGSGWKRVDGIVSAVTYVQRSVDLSRLRLVDLNGDGKTDIHYVAAPLGATAPDELYESIGGGKFAKYGGMARHLPSDLSDAALDLSRIKFGDFNGDGLLDIYRVEGAGAVPVADTIYFYKGKGTYAAPVAGPKTKVSDNIEIARLDLSRIRIGKFNRDRFADVYVIEGSGQAVADAIYLSHGDGTFGKVSGPKTAVSQDIKVARLNVASMRHGGYTGTGYSDLFVFRRGNVPELFTNDLRDPVLFRVTDGFGSFSEVTATPLTDPSTFSFSPPKSKFPVRDLSSPLYVVSALVKSDGIGGVRTTTYHYAGAKFQLQGVGFLGFSSIVQLNTAARAKTTHVYSQDYEKFFHPQLVETFVHHVGTDGETLVSHETAVLSANRLVSPLDPAPIYSVALSSKRQRKFDQHGTTLSTSSTAFAYDKFYNVILESVAESDGTQTYHTSTERTFNPSLSDWRLSLLRTQLVQRSVAGGPCPPHNSTITISYRRDPRTGLVIEKTEQPHDPLYCRMTRYTRGKYGNSRAEKFMSCDGRQSVVTSVTYDPRGRFVVQKTDALQFSERFEVDPMFGKKLSSVDIRGVKTSFLLDSLGSRVKTIRFDQNVTTTMEWAKTPPNAVFSLSEVASDGKTVVQVYDLLGRKIRKAKSGLDKFFQRDFRYDQRGDLIAESVPYFAGDAPKFIKHSYDDFRRKTRSVDVLGNVKIWSYGNNTVIFTSASAVPPQITTTKQNLFQKPLLRIDAAGYHTGYCYDSGRNLVRTTDHRLNRVEMKYDIYNRRTYLLDPDAGLVTSDYGLQGEVVRIVYNSSRTVSMTYDGLKRLTSRTMDGETATFVYDTASKGSLTSSSQPGYRQVLTYDPFGREVAETTTFDAEEPFVSRTFYDPMGHVSKRILPGDFSICYSYQNGVAVKTLSCDGKTEYEVVKSVNPFESPEELQFGNGVELTFTRRDDNAVRRIRSVSHDGKVLQDLHYDYTLTGLMKTRSDSIRGLQEDFSQYDKLNRLIASSVVHSRFPYSFQYDALGNIIDRAWLGVYFYDHRPHQVTRICPSPGRCPYVFTYDDDGNVISKTGDVEWGARKVRYATGNKPVWVSNGYDTVEYSYDPNRRRYQKISTSSGRVQTTLYVNAQFEVVKDSSGWALFKHFITPSVIHERNDTVERTLYVLKDHLGSVDVVTSETGTPLWYESYDAFGYPRSPKTWITINLNSTRSTLQRGYIFQEGLFERSLVHLNGRLYDPRMGRFLSPDPFVQDVYNPQNLNRYSYAFNNPLVIADPSGYWSLGGFFHDIGKAIGDLVHDIGEALGNLVHGIVSLLRNPIFQEIVDVAIAIVLSPTGVGEVFSVALLEYAAVDSAYTGFCVVIDGGSFEQALQAVGLEIVEDVTMADLGHFLKYGAGKSLNLLEKSFVHGAVSGGFSELRGGSFTTGFVSGAVGEAVSDLFSSKRASRHTAHAEHGSISSGLVGGVSSVAAGGRLSKGVTKAHGGFWPTAIHDGLKWASRGYHIYGLAKATSAAARLGAAASGLFWRVSSPLVRTGLLAEGLSAGFAGAAVEELTNPVGWALLGAELMYFRVTHPEIYAPFDKETMWGVEHGYGAWIGLSRRM